MSKIADTSIPTKQEISKEKEESYACKPRQKWSNSMEFLMSAIAYAVGLGAVWRYPYLCYENGGGVFIIPYLTCVIILGIPLVYLEMIVGQFSSVGPLTSWKMIKLTKGIGLSINLINAVFCIYYTMIIAYALYYMVLSLNLELPWVKCMPSFASQNCVDDFSPKNYYFTRCTNNETMLKCEDSYNFGRCFNITNLNGTQATCDTDRTLLEQIGWWKTSFPSQDYWNAYILKKSSGIEDLGPFVWQLFLALAVSWFLIYFMVFKGVKLSGKITWFTALFPYVILLILGIRGWMLPGARAGIEFYIFPQWHKLLELKVWRDAAVQVFFTFSISYGGISSLSSYNEFNHGIRRDAIFISLSNVFTSFFAGFVIFAYMGYLSEITKQDIGDIFQAGQGLSFVVYPYAVTTIPGAPVWSFLFFFMMVLLGIDSAMASVETSLTSLFDGFPSLKKTFIRKYMTITGLIFFYFVCGLIFCFGSGNYWVEWFNRYAGDWAVLFVGFIECIVLAWFYGLKNLEKDIDCMAGRDKSEGWLSYFWWPFWTIITPGVCITLAVMIILSTEPLLLGNYVFPHWTFIAGVAFTAFPLIGLFGWMFYEIYYTICVKKQGLYSLIKPDFEAYQPKLEENKVKLRKLRGLDE